MKGKVTTGTAWVFGDNVLNDGGVAPHDAARKSIFNEQELAKTCMAAIDPEFPNKAKKDDFIVAGKNFGKGQLHIQGPLSLKGLGVNLITESMTRSFFRLAIGAGVPILPFVSDVTAKIGDGDRLEVDFSRGLIRNLTRGTEIVAKPLPSFLLSFIEAGGEREWLRQNHDSAARRSIETA